MKYTKAFTLIELLVVISIISVLSSVILASTQNARKKADDAAIYKAMTEMRNAYEMEYSVKGNISSVVPTGVITSSGIVCSFSAGLSYGCSITNSNGCNTLYSASANINTVCKYLITKTPSFYVGISNISNGTINDTYSIYSQLKTDTTKYFCIRSNKTNSVTSTVSSCYDNSLW